METSYLIKLLKEISDIMAENKDKLIEMDGIVGDGDLGLTMSDGFKAAYDAVSDGAIADAGKLLFAAGKAMANKVPSTMGSLYDQYKEDYTMHLTERSVWGASGVSDIISWFRNGSITIN